MLLLFILNTWGEKALRNIGLDKRFQEFTIDEKLKIRGALRHEIISLPIMTVRFKNKNSQNHLNSKHNVITFFRWKILNFNKPEVNF